MRLDKHDITALHDLPCDRTVNAVALAFEAVPHEAPFDGSNVEILCLPSMPQSGVGFSLHGQIWQTVCADGVKREKEKVIPVLL